MHVQTHTLVLREWDCKLEILHHTSILSERITKYFLLWQCFLDGDVHLFYDAFPLSLLYPTSHFRFQQIRATQWEHTFHHVRTHPHHCTTRLSAHGITWPFWSVPAACCNTHSLFPRMTTLSSSVKNNRKLLLLSHPVHQWETSISPFECRQQRTPLNSGWEFQLASLI